jgi:hydroxyethylthiazole kinase-like sugar kinase family protein
MLLAAGASPAMIDNPDEVGQFAGLADLIGGGLYLNTGLHASQMSAMGAVGDWRRSSPDGILVVRGGRP